MKLPLPVMMPCRCTVESSSDYLSQQCSDTKSIGRLDWNMKLKSRLQDVIWIKTPAPMRVISLPCWEQFTLYRKSGACNRLLSTDFCCRLKRVASASYLRTIGRCT